MTGSHRSVLTVFGSLNVDIAVDVPRLPISGETLIGDAARLSAGGKGGNQAHAARRFGVETDLFGAVGDDAFAVLATAGLRAAGVDLSGVRTAPGQPTGIACITVDRDGENTIVVALGANSSARADAVSDEQLGRSGLLLLQMEAPPDESFKLAQRARSLGCPVMLNAAPWLQVEVPYRDIDWLVVNEIELMRLSEAHCIQAIAPADRARLVAQHTGTDVVLTLGATGAVIAGRDGGMLGRNALAGQVVDTTGAGDTFAGVFAAALLCGFSRADALEQAVVAAGLACRARGAQSAQPDRTVVEAAVSTRLRDQK